MLSSALPPPADSNSTMASSHLLVHTDHVSAAWPLEIAGRVILLAAHDHPTSTARPLAVPRQGGYPGRTERTFCMCTYRIKS
jgi:hypothetical protein